jgi:hypothetical protein
MTVRIVYQSPFWEIQQSTSRRMSSHNSSLNFTPDTVTRDWELRSLHDDFYNAVIELLQIGIEEDNDIDSIDIGWLHPGAPIIATLRSGLTSLTF